MFRVRTGLIGIGLIVFLLFFPGNVHAKDLGPSLIGQGAVLMDARNGQVLFQKNMRQQMYPASTTKILTAILALEMGNLYDLVMVPEEACRVEGSAIGLQAGERLSLNDLLYALMLASANDASVTIACHLAGSMDNFAALMNKKAKSLGATASNFTSPSGLPATDHYTCAYDLALITRYALQNTTFREIVKTRLKIISRPEADRTKGPPQEHLWNHNRFLECYQRATGVKTGYTEEAGQCLAAAAQRDDRELIAIVLNSQGDAIYEDAQKLLDYGFNNFMPVQVVEKGEKIASVEVAQGKPAMVELITANAYWYNFPRGDFPDLTRRVQLAPKIKAPLQAGQKMGELGIYGQEQKIGEVDLVAAQTLDKISNQSWLYWLAGIVLFAFYLRVKATHQCKRRLYRRAKRYNL